MAQRPCWMPGGASCLTCNGDRGLLRAACLHVQVLEEVSGSGGWELAQVGSGRRSKQVGWQVPPLLVPAANCRAAPCLAAARLALRCQPVQLWHARHGPVGVHPGARLA
jgi:hypothetical protein